MDLFEDIGSSRPKGKGQLVPALLTTGANAAGGLVAGRLDGVFSNMFPGRAWMSTIGILFACVAIRMMFHEESEEHAIARELAGGMAGWAGDDLWAGLNLLLRKSWAQGKFYQEGDKVVWEGKVWRASKNIPISPLQTPGESRDWVVTVADGFRLQDMKQAAQAFRESADLDAISDATYVAVGPELERLADKRFSDEERAALRKKMRSVLRDTIDATA